MSLEISGNKYIEEAELPDGLGLIRDENGLALMSGDQVLRGDFTKMLHRVKHNSISHELLVKAAKIKGADGPRTAIDATAGLGEDSLLLAAAGFHVKMYERNPVIFELLSDALRRAAEVPELADIVARMEVFNEDSVEVMKKLAAELCRIDVTSDGVAAEPACGNAAEPAMPPDIILLDPMFPERQKSALVKKKLQMIQKLEIPCDDEEEILFAAMSARPKKLIVKRPPKGPFLAGVKPDYSNKGKAVRYDCFVSPYDRIGKFKK